MSLILVVEDNPGMREGLSEVLREAGHEVCEAVDGEEALEIIAHTNFDLAIVDLKLPGIDGIEVLRQLKKRDVVETAAIMITAYGTIEAAVEAMKLGAKDFITKPISIDELELKVERILELQRLHWENRRLTLENQYLKQEQREQYGIEQIIGNSRKMKEVFQMIEAVAPTRSVVLIYGESGTGKELAAGAIHYHSPRRECPFVKVSCAALPEGMIESELFGHERGAFTGADKQRIGRFEVADGGTIFLDEIGELSISTQTKLLRVLQEQTFERVGSSKPICIDVRIIAATNKDLQTAVKDGSFRDDLFYRLNVVPINLPPLRERKKDIPLLVEHFLKKYSQRMNKRILKVQPSAMNLLMVYSWPGNVRQLENVIERCVVLGIGDTLTAEQLPPEIRNQRDSKEPLSLPEKLEAMEKRLILNALERAGGIKAEAAKQLGIPRSVLHYKLQKYGLSTDYGNALNGLANSFAKHRPNPF